MIFALITRRSLVRVQFPLLSKASQKCEAFLFYCLGFDKVDTNFIDLQPPKSIFEFHQLFETNRKNTIESIRNPELSGESQFH